MNTEQETHSGKLEADHRGPHDDCSTGTRQTSAAIFKDGPPLPDGPVLKGRRSPASVAPESSSDSSLAPKQGVASHPVSLDQRIIDIIESPPLPEEQKESAFRRKEYELGEFFATLTVSECRALHRRLRVASLQDPLVVSFGRMVAVRRARLLAFLADARRREAMALASKANR